MSVTLRWKPGKKHSAYLDIYCEGKRQYEFLGIRYDPKNRIEKKDAKIQAEILKGKRLDELENSGQEINFSSNKKIDFVEFFKKIVDEKSSDAWINTYHYLVDFTDGSIRIKKVNDLWLMDFREFLLKQKLMKTSAKLYFSKIVAALNVAIKKKIISTNPIIYIDPFPKIKDREKKPKVWLTMDEVNQLYKTECNNPEIKKGFLFACFCGLRISDLKALGWDNVIKEDKKYQLDFHQQKTGRRQAFFLDPRAVEFLNGEIKNIDKVFNLPSRTRVNIILKKWARRAGIRKHVTSHVGRHTFSAWFYKKYRDIYLLSARLGHSSVKMTENYIDSLAIALDDPEPQRPEITKIKTS